MFPPHRIIEQMATQTLLGIRFWDPVTDTQVADGLHVTGQLLTDVNAPTGRIVSAHRVPSGHYAFFGLHKAERAAPDTPLGEGIPRHTLALIEVYDAMGRFLPMSFKAPIPFHKPFRGVGDDAWQAHPLMLPVPDPDQEKGVYLWSAPGRIVPPGVAVLYAHLAAVDSNGENEEQSPVAYTLVRVLRQVEVDTWIEHAYGVADKRGMLTLPLPYPAIPEQSVNNSAPPLNDQTFNLKVQFFTRSDALVTPPGWKHPDMVQILLQPQAKVLVAVAPQELESDLEVSLTFQTPVVLRTKEQDGKPGSYLRLRTDN